MLIIMMIIIIIVFFFCLLSWIIFVKLSLKNKFFV
jgi:hypothetical protein